MLNDRCLFVSYLVSTNNCSLITVGGDDYRNTQYGIAEILVSNDEDDSMQMQLPEALCFPSSPFKILSIDHLIKHCGNGPSDAET